MGLKLGFSVYGEIKYTIYNYIDIDTFFHLLNQFIFQYNQILE